MYQMFGLHQRHSRLFIVLCFFPLMSFAVYHYIEKNYYLSFVLVISALFFALNFVNIQRHQLSMTSRMFVILALFTCLAVAIYSVGLYGFLYVFPTLIGLFFLLPLRASLYFSTVLALSFIYLMHLFGEPLLAIKLVVPILLTIVFTAFFAYFSKFQQNALGEETKKDPLTRMANRHAFNEWLNHCNLNNEITSITTIHINIDNFRVINDTYGFKVGDKVIQEVASTLASLADRHFATAQKNNYFMARFSGDIFTIGLTNLAKNYDPLHFINACKHSVIALNIMPESAFVLSVSASVATTRRTDGDLINTIENIDSALQHDKKLGKNSLQILDKTTENYRQEKKYIAIELSQALSNNQFYLTFMTIFRDDASNIVGAELLIRCDREELSRIGPEKFIPIAEECGLIEQIDYWVIQESFQLIARHAMLQVAQIEFYSINISSHQLRNKDFVHFISHQLNQVGLDPALIELELTETSLVETDLQAIETLMALKRLGIKLSLDDFGTGYTSFNQLKHFPLNSLKIDKSFVSGDLENNTPVDGMAAVILSIAKLYDFKVIAEGIETNEQYQKLKADGCHYFQGYLFSKPLPLKGFIYLLNHNSH